MAAITAKQEQEKKGRVAKGVEAMKKPAAPEGTLRRISIRPAENGFTVGTDREMPPSKEKDGDQNSSMAYSPTKDAVFSGDNAVDDALAHIRNHMVNKGC